MTTSADNPRPLNLALLAVLVLFQPGCRRDEAQRYQTPKDSAAQPEMAATPSLMPPTPMPPAPKGSLAWTLPKGWTASQGGGMRYATLKPPAAADISVVLLAGSAGGELANVNRWRNQIGLPPIDEKALATERRIVKTPAGQVSLFDLTSEGPAKRRMIVGLLGSPSGDTWFLKMTGDEAPVAKTRAEFLQWIGSLRLD